MKTVLISLIMLIATNSSAEGIATNSSAEGIRYGGAGASIFAKLQIKGMTRNMTLINPRFNSVASASITFNEKSLILTLNKSMPTCTPGMMCIQVMPLPAQIKLDVIKVEQTECTTKYTARTPANIKTNIIEEVIIEDLTHSQCLSIMPVPRTLGHIIYSVTGAPAPSFSESQKTATAHFLVEGEFIRVQN